MEEWRVRWRRRGVVSIPVQQSSCKPGQSQTPAPAAADKIQAVINKYNNPETSMKLYVSPRTPNPRRVTMFIAEKGIAEIGRAHV